MVSFYYQRLTGQYYKQFVFQITTLRFKIDTLIMFTTLRQYLTTYHAGVHACTVSICSTRVTYVISNHVDA